LVIEWEKIMFRKKIGFLTSIKKYSANILGLEKSSRERRK